MRLVAGIAGRAAGVFGGDHLREISGFGRVPLVASPAKIPDIGEFRGDGTRVVGMFGQRTMAGFAGDVRMFAGGAELSLVVVAHHAGILACVGQRAGADQIEGGRPVMSEFAEVLRYDGSPNHQKDPHRGYQNQCRADEVSTFRKQTAQEAPFFGRLNYCHGVQAATEPSASTRAGSSTINTIRFSYLKIMRAG